jgi:hypothetical protein
LGLGFACDGPEGRPRRRGRERDNRVVEEDDPVQHQLRDWESLIDQRREGTRVGARRPGASPRPEAGRYRRPAAPRSGAALITRYAAGESAPIRHAAWACRESSAATTSS